MGHNEMILPDTHIWVWWLTRSTKLKAKNRNLLENSNQLYLSVICLWEVAKAVEKGKIQFKIGKY